MFQTLFALLWFLYSSSLLLAWTTEGRPLWSHGSTTHHSLIGHFLGVGEEQEERVGRDYDHPIIMLQPESFLLRMVTALVFVAWLLEPRTWSTSRRSLNSVSSLSIQNALAPPPRQPMGRSQRVSWLCHHHSDATVLLLVNPDYLRVTFKLVIF